MIYKNYDELYAILKERGEKEGIKKTFAFAGGDDAHSIEAAIQVLNDKIARPILIGDEEKILGILNDFDFPSNEIEIINVTDGEEACAQMAIDLANAGDVQFIVKGLVNTAAILRVALKRENHFKERSLISVVGLTEMPNYHKLFCATDGALNMYPTLEEKKEILLNAVEFYHNMGVECPKVSVLATLETVNPKMPETVDARALKEMNQNGEITGCLVEGPISIDVSFSKEAAEIKGFESEVAGDPDILVFPNITTANMTMKAMELVAPMRSGGFAFGLKEPIVITSRATSVEGKVRGILQAAVQD